MCILNKGHADGFMTKLCFGDGDVFVDITLLNTLAINSISIYNVLCPEAREKNIF